MKAKATAPASEYVTDLRWKFPSDKWFTDINADVAYERLVDWLMNFRVNLQTIGFDHSVSDLPQIKGSALVIDKSMASTKYFEQLSEIKNYEGVVIACDRALPTLIQNGIIPHYVCQLDSSYLCQFFFDVPQVKKWMKEIKAVFAVTTHPLTIRLWHGPRYFFTPYMGSFSLTKTLMTHSGAPYMQTGGQVASFCWLLAYNLGAKNIGVFGVTHGVDDLSETEYPHVHHVRKEGPHGIVFQDPVYDWYNETWLRYIKNLSRKDQVKTINTMQAGLLYDGKYVVDMSLKGFVEKFG